MSEYSDNIARILCTKSALKQQLFKEAKQHFTLCKVVAAHLAEWMQDQTCQLPETIELRFEELNEFEGALHFGGDLLLLHMHTNIFTFEKSHSLWKQAYFKEDKDRAYFSTFYIYNFLADSFRFNRERDAGVLLCRIFVNKEGHFFSEGQKSLAKPLSNIKKQKLNQEAWQQILSECAEFALQFDLTAPPFADIMLPKVGDMRAKRSELQMRTAKKLGYKYD